MTHSHTAEDIAAALAENLASPADHHDTLGPAQSLADGAAGIALLHAERAHRGHGDWPRAQTWLTVATGDKIHLGGDAGLFFGAPACGFVVDHAATARPGTLSRALATLIRASRS